MITSFKGMAIIRSKYSERNFSAWYVPSVNTMIIFPFASHYNFMVSVIKAVSTGKEFTLLTPNPNPYDVFPKNECEKIDKIIKAIPGELPIGEIGKSEDKMSKFFNGQGWVRINYFAMENTGTISNKVSEVPTETMILMLSFFKEELRHAVNRNDIKIFTDTASYLGIKYTDLDDYIKKINKDVSTAVRSKAFSTPDMFIKPESEKEKDWLYENSFRKFYRDL